MMKGKPRIGGVAISFVLITGSFTGAQVPEIDITNVPIVHPTAGAMTTPITHQKYFRGERELFGYNPRYTSASVTFDVDNIPYIRVGVNPQGHDVYGEFTTLGVIQTLDSTGQWISLTSWLDAIKGMYSGWDRVYNAGVSNDERIIFDSSGDAYMVVNTCYDQTVGFAVLLHSKDKCRTWSVYPLPSSIFFVKLEQPEAWNDTGNPPVLSCWPYGWTGGPVYLIAPTKTGSGRLNIPPMVTLTSDPYAYGTPIQSGMGNSAITKGNLVHAVYLRNAASPDNTTGTPQYIVTYNRTTGTVTGPVFLGASDSTVPDIHDGPALTIDSQGYLHAIFGSHGGQFKYTKSLVPNSITGGWTTPVAIGATGDAIPEWTYISLLCDKNDTLHVVGRYSGHGYYFGLWYLRKKAGQNWESLGPLAMPFRAYYSNWYQKLTMDRQGRLFLNYIYYGDQYDRGTSTFYEIDNYTAKWPWEGAHELIDPVNTSWSNLSAHEPCVIMSDDGGDHWRLALTSSMQVYFASNTFENGLDGWTLANSPSTSPLQAVSSYTYNGKTITPRTGTTFARSAASSYYKKASRIVSPAQYGVFTGYLNLVENTNIGMIEFYTTGQTFILLANSVSGKVSYRINGTETPTSIGVTPQAWHEVKFIAGPAGTEGYWDGTLLFHDPATDKIAQIIFGSEWASAPCGYDDFSFLPVTRVQGNVALQGFSGTPAGIPVVFTFFTPGTATPLETHSAALDASGHYSLYTPLTGTYDLRAKASHWLAEKKTHVVLGDTGVDFTMTRNGDANNDNAVLFEDFSILQNNYGQSGRTGEQGDFNGDGNVTFEDFSILQNNYGQTGLTGPVSAAESVEGNEALLTTGVPCSSPGLVLLSLMGSALSMIASRSSP